MQVGDDGEGSFDAIFVCETGVQTVEVSFAIEAEDVSGISAGKSDEFTGFTPVDLSYLSVLSLRVWLYGWAAPYFSRLNFNPPNEAARFPVKHADASLTSDTEKDATTKTLGLEANIKRAALF